VGIVERATRGAKAKNIFFSKRIFVRGRCDARLRLATRAVVPQRCTVAHYIEGVILLTFTEKENKQTEKRKENNECVVGPSRIVCESDLASHPLLPLSRATLWLKTTVQMMVEEVGVVEEC